MSEAAISTAPNGEQFPLPTPQDEATEILRLQALVAEHRAQGHEIVVVLGVGFVGAVMAGIIADSVRKEIGGHDAASCPLISGHRAKPKNSGSCPPISRPTHSNMIFPGPGIGDYCLPKDGGLGVWSYQTLMGFEDDIFKITPLTPGFSGQQDGI